MAKLHDDCLLCSCSELQPVKTYIHHHLVKCRNCGFVFVKVVPSLEELAAYYDDYPVKDHRSAVTIKRYNELLDKFEKYRSTNKLLDIGCGTGYFLDEAKKRGWVVHGTEYSPLSIASCRERGISICEGQLNGSNYDADQFDVITSFEVIEHINDPKEELDKINRILRPNGLLYITTPNYNSLSRHFVGPNWSIVNYPEHLSYYTPSTLNFLLKNRGFDRKWVMTTGISISRFKGSKDIEGQENVDPENDDEKLRIKMETNALLKFAKWSINAFLNFFKIGDSLKAAYIKR